MIFSDFCFKLWGFRLFFAFLVWLATILFFGWILWPPAEKTFVPGFDIKFENGEFVKKPVEIEATHLAGLRFVPACVPFGADAFCGSDLSLVIPVTGFFCFAVLEVFLFLIPEYNPEKKRRRWEWVS